jgi:uncharacterized membrane protein
MKPITTLQTTSATFSIGQALSDGWAIVSKNLGYYILGGILAVLIGGAAGIIPFIGSIANNIIIGPCFLASAIFISWHISKGIAWTDFGELFKGFNFLLPVAISSLIQSVAAGVLVVLFFFNYMPQLKDIYDLITSPGAYNNRAAIEAITRQFLNTETLLLFLLLMLALLLLSVIWAFKNHFIVIYKLEAWPAMEMSRKITTNNLLPLAGLFLLLGIIVIISALPCGIGLLFSLPLSITAVYSAFAQITDCDKTAIDNDMFDFINEENKEF